MQNSLPTQQSAWQGKKLGEIATLHRGYDLPIEKMTKGTHPVIFSNGKIEYHNAYKIKGPGVVTGRSGSLGNTFYIENDYWPHNTTLYVSDFHGNNPKFVYYLLKTLNFAFLNAGSGVPTLNRNHVHEIQLIVPKDAQIQKQIASILSAFDDKIEVNNKIAKTLEEMAQAIFKEWFVDNKKEEWEKGTLSDIAEVNPETKIGKGENIPYVEMKDLPEQGMWFSPSIDREYKGSGSKFKNYDTLLARITPCLENGKTGYVQCLDDKVAWGSTEFLVFRPKDIFWREWIYLLARSNHFRSYAIGAMVGSSGRQRVPAENMKKYSLIIPEQLTIEKFHKLVEPMFQKIKTISLENQKLAGMRDLLLPKLMKGEIQV